MKGVAWGLRRGRLGLSPLFLFVSLALAVLFLAWPALDIWFSGLFWTPEKDFFWKKAVLVKGVYRSVELVSMVSGVGLLVWGLVMAILPGFRRKQRIRFVLFGLLLLAMGPGLVVNFVFKDHWGRARPTNVEALGGNLTFTPAFVLSDQCDRNCSFASGHASAAAWLLCMALFRGKKRRWVYPSALYFAVVGLGRIVQGGHFLSDVIFAFVFVYASACVLDRFLYPPQRDPESVL